MRYIVDSVIKNCLGVERDTSIVPTRFRNYELKTTNSFNFAYANLSILGVINKGFPLETFLLTFFDLHPLGRLKFISSSHLPPINPSVWSDERCSSQRKHFLQWSNELCSSWCSLSLIRLYLDNFGSKCIRATLCLFMKELAILWCGKQLLEFIYSFFSLLSKFGFSFCSP